MKKIIFYNHFHNGDIHVSRTFINDIVNKSGLICEYHHNCNHEHLSDIKITQKAMTLQEHSYPNNQIIFEQNDIIYINTWYNPSFAGYQKYGCSLPALYENFKTVYQHLNIVLENIQFYIPKINFLNFDIAGVNKFMYTNKQKKVYISNGPVQSGQSVNFDFNPIIVQLSLDFPDRLFILSNKTNLVETSNIIYSESIIQKPNNIDLCENAYLMAFCDTLIGRCSGPFTFGLIPENLQSEKRQQWINICNINPSFGVTEFLHPNKEFYWFNFYDGNQIYREITNILKTI
jgi:hypothetical protein